jgi:hypothetical protein
MKQDALQTAFVKEMDYVGDLRLAEELIRRTRAGPTEQHFRHFD